MVIALPLVATDLVIEVCESVKYEALVPVTLSVRPDVRLAPWIVTDLVIATPVLVAPISMASVGRTIDGAAVLLHPSPLKPSSNEPTIPDSVNSVPTRSPQRYSTRQGKSTNGFLLPCTASTPLLRSISFCDTGS